MTTQASVDNDVMEERAEFGPERMRHRPARGSETPEARHARIAAITKAVRNGTYDTAPRAALGAEAFCDALFSGRARR